MAVQAALVVGFETGVKIVSAKAYGATWDQAALFSAIHGSVTIILNSLVDSYLQNSRQLILSHIVIQTAGGLAGVLVTRLVCEKAIHWKSVLASAVFSDTAASFACPLFMKPVPLTSFIKVTES